MDLIIQVHINDLLLMYTFSQGKGPLSEKYGIKTEKEMIRAPTNPQAMATSDSTAEVFVILSINNYD